MSGPLIDQWCSGCGEQLHEGEPLHKRTDPGHSAARAAPSVTQRMQDEFNADVRARRAAAPPGEPTPGLREALHFKADLLQRDDSRDYSHQVVRLADVHAIIDEALAASPAPEPTGLDEETLATIFRNRGLGSPESLARAVAAEYARLKEATE